MPLSTTVKLLPRRIHVFLCAFLIYLRIKVTQLSLRWRRASDASQDRAWSRTHTRCGEQLARLARRRGALWLKFAQYTASRADVLPPEYAAALDKCLDDAPPLPADVARAAVDTELAALGGVDGAFTGFDPADPIASASIAQVHRAKLKKDGRDVVVKVQRPGVKALLLQDLTDLGTILNIVAGAEPAFDFRPMLEAWMEMVPRETDFVEEMRNSDGVSGVLRKARGGNYESKAFVPDCIAEYTTEKVLCVDYVDGCSIRDVETLRSAGVDCDALVTEITKAFALQLLVLGRFTGDPHPGNCLVQIERKPDGSLLRATPALIDFGITVELSEVQRVGFCRTIVAAVDNDTFSLLQSFADMDIKMNSVDPQASMETVQHLFRSTASREENIRESREFMDKQAERQDRFKESAIAVDVRGEDTSKSADASIKKKKKLFRIPKRGGAVEAGEGMVSSGRRNPVDAYPGFLVFMFRTLGLLRGLSARLGVQHAYLPIMYGYAKKSLQDSVPVPERRLSVIYPEVGVGESSSQLAPSVPFRKSRHVRRIVCKVLEAVEQRGHFVGCQVAAYIDGKLVLDVAAGQTGKYNSRPVTPSTLFNVFSVTKGVMAIMFAGLCDEYGIKYDDLVGKHWPAFACKGKENTTVGDLLAHRAGIAQASPENMKMLRLRDDWRGIMNWLASDAVPTHTPGDKAEYHFFNYGWLLAGMIENVSGAPLETRLREFKETLGVADECFVGLPKELCPDVPESRVASIRSELFKDIEKMMRRRQVSANSAQMGDADVQGANVDRLYGDKNGTLGDRKGMEHLFQQLLTNSPGDDDDEESDTEEESTEDVGETMAEVFAKTPYMLEPQYFSHPVMRAAVIPSANGHFSARALARIFGMVANDGKIDGVQVLKPGRAGQMANIMPWSPSATAKRETSEAKGKKSTPESSPMDFMGAGLRVYDCVDAKGKDVKSKAIGHGGIGGSIAFCIPDKKFSFAFCCNQLNAFSVTEAVLISAVCTAFGMPIPSSFGKLMKKARGKQISDDTDPLQFIESELNRALDEFNIVQAMTG